MGDLIKVEDYLPSVEIIKEIVIENLGGKLTQRDLERYWVEKTSFLSTYDSDVKEIECILLGKRNEKRFYVSDDIDRKPPDCYSTDCINGIGDPGGDCETCELNQFIDGMPKRCKDRVEVIFIKKGDVLPSRISLPTMSTNPFRKYLLKLSSQGKKFKNVVTKMSLKIEKNKQGKPYGQVVFSEVGPIQYEEIKELLLPGF